MRWVGAWSWSLHLRCFGWALGRGPRDVGARECRGPCWPPAGRVFWQPAEAGTRRGGLVAGQARSLFFPCPAAAGAGVAGRGWALVPAGRVGAGGLLLWPCPRSGAGPCGYQSVSGRGEVSGCEVIRLGGVSWLGFGGSGRLLGNDLQSTPWFPVYIRVSRQGNLDLSASYGSICGRG